MGQHLADVDTLKAIVDLCNKAVLVALYVKDCPFIDDIGACESPAYICKILPKRFLRDAKPGVQCRFDFSVSQRHRPPGRHRYQPRVCSKCASSSVDTASPFMAPARSSLTSSNTLGSLKCVAACTIAFARFSASAGSANSVEFFMKMPEPTNTASAPSCITSDASAGVAIPPAEKFGTGNLPSRATIFTSS